MVPYTVLISGVRPFRSRIDPGLGWQNWPADPEAGSRRRTAFQDRAFMRLCGTRSRRSGQGKTNMKYVEELLTDWFAQKNLRQHNCIYNVYNY